MRKTPFIIIIIVLILVISGSVFYYLRYVQPKKEVNVTSDIQVFVPTGAILEQVYDSLSRKVSDAESLKKVGRQLDFSKVYPGRYTFQAGTTNEEIIERLQKGEQDEIEIMVGNYASIYELADKLAPFLETNAQAIIHEIMSRPEMSGKDTLAAIYFLTPDTYRFHWNNSAKDIVEKINRPYKTFWTEERKALLRQSGYSELQVMALASIVQMESYRTEEQPKVAGVYLNRLKKGMKLQADPTVVFAKKARDGWQKKINRVYYKDLAIESPYNTYRYAGIPPGPICMPNRTAIDAVLKPEAHDYIFFVADTTQNGLHIFASDISEHEKNAQVYRSWADRNNIR